MMLELFEALNDRLIGPKTWDQIVVNFEAQIMQAVTEHGWFGLLDCALCIYECFDVYEAEKGRETRVHKVNR